MSDNMVQLQTDLDRAQQDNTRLQIDQDNTMKIKADYKTMKDKLEQLENNSKTKEKQMQDDHREAVYAFNGVNRDLELRLQALQKETSNQRKSAALSESLVEVQKQKASRLSLMVEELKREKMVLVKEMSDTKTRYEVNLIK